MKKIKVLVKEPLKAAEVMEIDNTLEAKQKIVNGYIELLPFGELDLFANEEGKFIGLKPNLIIKEGLYTPTVIVGTVYVSKTNKNGKAISLTEKDIIKAKAQLDKIAL